MGSDYFRGLVMDDETRLLLLEHIDPDWRDHWQDAEAALNWYKERAPEEIRQALEEILG